MFDIQRSFGAGEIAPALYGRADVARFSTALRTCRNFVVRKEGGVKNRTGSQFVCATKDSTKRTRLIKFVFNNNDTYICEFGHQYIRFVRNGAQVTSAGSPYEISSPYDHMDLAGIQYAQSGDVITLTHPSYDVRELTRISLTNWTLTTPVFTADPFTASNNYPSTVTFFQQRRIFARTNAEPENIWPSKIGDFFDFTTGVNAADSFEVKLSGSAVSQVRHLVGANGRFVVLTTGGVWLIAGGSDGTLTPTGINARQYNEYGSGTVRPAVVGTRILYQQERGSLVREAAYSFSEDGLSGQDLTIYSSHLFNGKTLAAMDYALSPDSVLWCVSSDGRLLGLTYLPEQEVWGWHRHDTDGTYEDVCVVPEGNYDGVYVVVNRSGGRYIERFADPFYSTDSDDARFVDSWLSYNGANTGATTITASGTAWTSNDTVTLTASAGQFIAGDVGNEYRLTIGGVEIAFRVTGYTSTTVVSARPQVNVPVSHRGVATASWTRAVDDLSGLSHLNGKTVSVLGDRAYVGQFTVSGGAITLPAPRAKIVVGLPITSEIELLDIEQPQGMTLIDSKKKVVKVKLMVESSRAIKASSDGGVTFDVAVPSGFDNSDYAAAPSLKTGIVEIATVSNWNDNGRIIIRQEDPLPLTVLAAAPVYDVGRNY